MAHRSGRSWSVSLCTLTCAAAVALSVWSPARRVSTDDQNHDGRPDAWRTYDNQGRLSDQTIDTNFDGRPDVHEYYERGALVRRETDRDFNSRIDLVQEFNPATREHARSVVDTDFDGTADLVVLFQDGRPVYSKWAVRATPPPVSPVSPVRYDATLYAEAARGPADGQLAAFTDPFRDDLSVRPVQLAGALDQYVGLCTSGGLPAPRTGLVSPHASWSGAAAVNVSVPSSLVVVPYAPRGPPPSCSSI